MKTSELAPAITRNAIHTIRQAFEKDNLWFEPTCLEVQSDGLIRISGDIQRATDNIFTTVAEIMVKVMVRHEEGEPPLLGREDLTLGLKKACYPVRPQPPRLIGRWESDCELA